MSQYDLVSRALKSVLPSVWSIESVLRVSRALSRYRIVSVWAELTGKNAMRRNRIQRPWMKRRRRNRSPSQADEKKKEYKTTLPAFAIF